jgi:outer membrane lipoprotein-sorting protein
MEDKMKNISLLAGFLVVSIFTLGAQSADEIVSKADAIFTLNNIYQKSTMTIIRNGKEQPVQLMESFFLKENGVSRTLTLFLEPRRVKGTAYLSVGDDLWVRFASTGRIRKMSSSAKKNSAGGSDFSYSDMGEGNTGYAEKYYVTLDGSVKVDGTDCYRIILTPKPGSKDTYEKAVAYIAKEDFSYRDIELYEDGAHIKTMTFSDFRPLRGLSYPYTIQMRSLARNSVSTVETMEMEIDSGKVEPRLFSQSYLEAIR